VNETKRQGRIAHHHADATVPHIVALLGSTFHAAKISMSFDISKYFKDYLHKSRAYLLLLPRFNSWAQGAKRGGLDAKNLCDGVVIVVEIILKDQEHVLRGGEWGIGMLPLTPTFGAQLGEVVYQTLLLIWRYMAISIQAIFFIITDFSAKLIIIIETKPTGWYFYEAIAHE